MGIGRRLVVVLTLCLAFAGVAYAGEDAPFSIAADSMEMDQKRQMALFDGNVEASQGDMILKAEKMRVYYREKENKKKSKKKSVGPQEIAKVEASGGVSVIQGKYRGQADRVSFVADKNYLELVGSSKKPASINSGKDQLVGSRILLYLSKDRRIERIKAIGGGKGSKKGGKRRVKASFSTKNFKKDEITP